MTWYKIQRTTIIGNALEVNIHLIVHVLCTKFDVVTIQSKLLVEIQVNKCFLCFAYFDFTRVLQRRANIFHLHCSFKTAPHICNVQLMIMTSLAFVYLLVRLQHGSPKHFNYMQYIFVKICILGVFTSRSLTFGQLCVTQC